MDTTSLFSIKGKTALVTGGSRGIGYMISEGFVSAGARVYICARKAEAAAAAAAELGRHGECSFLQADLSSKAGADALSAEIAKREDSLHILVNNAGATWGAPLEDFPESGFDKVLDTNVKGIYYLTAALLPLMRKVATADDPARVINIGSVDGISPPHGNNFPYSASKAAVHHLTRHLASQLVGEHINVNAIAPGLFQSKMTQFIYDAATPEEVVSGIPMKRDGSAEDIAGTAIYLSSRAGAYLTGVVIPVSGGWATLT